MVLLVTAPNVSSVSLIWSINLIMMYWLFYLEYMHSFVGDYTFSFLNKVKENISRSPLHLVTITWDTVS